MRARQEFGDPGVNAAGLVQVDCVQEQGNALVELLAQMIKLRRMRSAIPRLVQVGPLFIIID